MTQLHDGSPREALASAPESTIRCVNLQPTLRYLPPAQILHVKIDLRQRDTPEFMMYFERFRADVRERGVIQPLIGFVEGDLIRLLEGQTRLDASILERLESVPILVHPVVPDAAMQEILKLQSNAMRKDMTDLEYAASYRRLMELNGLSQTELGLLLHVSQATISKRLTISSNLAPELQAKVAAGTLAPAIAYAISRLADHAKQIALETEAAVKNWKRDVVEAKVKMLLGKKEPKGKTLKIVVGGVTIMIRNPTPEAIQAALDKVGAGLKKLLKDNLPISILQELLG